MRRRWSLSRQTVTNNRANLLRAKCNYWARIRDVSFRHVNPCWKFDQPSGRQKLEAGQGRRKKILAWDYKLYGTGTVRSGGLLLVKVLFSSDECHIYVSLPIWHFIAINCCRATAAYLFGNRGRSEGTCHNIQQSDCFLRLIIAASLNKTWPIKSTWS